MNRRDEWYEVESFGERDVRFVEAPRTLPCALYLLRGSEAGLLIDSGLGIGDLRGLVAEYAETDVRLFLTHTHWDHIGAGHQFESVAASHRECPNDRVVAIDSLSDEFVERPGEFVESHRAAGEAFPDEFDPDAYRIPPVAGVDPVTANDVVDLGDRTLELVDVAGHSPGQLGVLDRERGVLYGGDVLHVNLGVYAHFEDSSLDRYVETLERLVDLRDGGAFDTLATAHNPPLSGGGLAVLDRLLSGLEAIRVGERAGETVETPWGEASRYEVGESEVLTKPSV